MCILRPCCETNQRARPQWICHLTDRIPETLPCMSNNPNPLGAFSSVTGSTLSRTSVTPTGKAVPSRLKAFTIPPQMPVPGRSIALIGQVNCVFSCGPCSTRKLPFGFRWQTVFNSVQLAELSTKLLSFRRTDSTFSNPATKCHFAIHQRAPLSLRYLRRADVELLSHLHAGRPIWKLAPAG